VKTKWLVGLKVKTGETSGRKVRVYWKLLDINGPLSSSGTGVGAKLETQLLRSNGSPSKYKDEVIF